MADVSTPHYGIATMQDDWDLIDALRGGTQGMRQAGKLYLPQRKLEDDQDYKCRLAVATLFPAFTETVQSMVGRVFAKQAVVDEGKTPEWIRNEVLPNIDLQGRNLHVFCYDWFREAFEYGLSHVLIDSPPAEGVRTVADQKAKGVRPYAVKISPRNIIGWRTNSKGELVQLRVRFCVEREEGEFGVGTVEQVRVYTMVGDGTVVVTYEKSGEKWVELPDSRATLPLKRIPLVTYYTGRVGYMLARPPLRELAYLNAKHWSMQSSNDGLVETASVPILVVTGVTEGDDLVIGAKHAVKLPVGGDMKYVEHTGAAISAGREALRELKEEMREAGAKLLRTNDVAKNELQAGEEAARENSDLGQMTRAFEDAVADMLDLIAEWRGESEGGAVKLQPNLDADLAPVDSMGIVTNLRDAAILSDETAFNEAKRRGLIDESLTWEEEQERIANQPPPAAAPAPPVKKPPAVAA